jgi:NADPH:quinone reductase-like Zn-dependent oxidoreductase
MISRRTRGCLRRTWKCKGGACDRVPEGLNLSQAGIFCGAYTTAFHASCATDGAREPVHGEGGGIGIAAIRVAKAFGASVIATPAPRQGGLDRITALTDGQRPHQVAARAGAA